MIIMIKAVKTWYNYLIAVGILALLVAGGILPYYLVGPEKWPAAYICYFLLLAGVIVLGVGFIVQDLYRGVIRKRINDWDNKLDDKYLNVAWAIFYPMLVSGLLSILGGLISYIFIK